MLSYITECVAEDKDLIDPAFKFIKGEFSGYMKKRKLDWNAAPLDANELRAALIKVHREKTMDHSGLKALVLQRLNSPKSLQEIFEEMNRKSPNLASRVQSQQSVRQWLRHKLKVGSKATEDQIEDFLDAL